MGKNSHGFGKVIFLHWNALKGVIMLQNSTKGELNHEHFQTF